MNRYTIFAFLLSLVFISCKKDKEEGAKEFRFDFAENTEGWEGFFSDYPAGSESFYELEFAHAYLPAPLDGTVRALKISGNNHSDDLLALVVKKIDNLKPDYLYSVTFDIELASNVTSNSPGAGGSPDLEFGVGGLSYKPENTVDAGYYRANFVSLLQSRQSNDVLQSVGRIGVSDAFPAPYTLVNRNNLSEPMQLKTNSNGEMWLMIGTDSGFEGITTLYYKSIIVKMK